MRDGEGPDRTARRGRRETRSTGHGETETGRGDRGLSAETVFRLRAGVISVNTEQRYVR